MRIRLAGALAASVPALAFAIVFAVTCMIGALLLLWGQTAFVDAFVYFTGTNVPVLTPEQARTAFVLLVLPPLCLGAGYAVAVMRAPIPWRTASGRPAVLGGRAALALSFALATVALLSLVRSGSLGSLSAWLSYQAWVDARQEAFHRMSFFEFVNIYTWLPLAAAWAVIAAPRARIVRWVPTLLAIAFALAIYQKKAALIVLILVLSAWTIDRARRGEAARALRVLALCTIGGLVLYAAMILVPTVEPFVARIGQGPASARSVSDVLVEWLGYEVSPQHGVLPQVIVNTLGRTAGPALTYPIVFPDRHPFYGPDVGQDVLCSPRIGCRGPGMPDDNRVVWQQMYPELPGGTITAPFQFALYSQAGVAWALLGALALGLILGFWWKVVRSNVIASPWSALAGAVAMLLGVNLALDSARNGILVSYGALWGILFVGVLVATDHLWRRITRVSHVSLEK